MLTSKETDRRSQIPKKRYHQKNPLHRNQAFTKESFRATMHNLLKHLLKNILVPMDMAWYDGMHLRI